MRLVLFLSVAFLLFASGCLDSGPPDKQHFQSILDEECQATIDKDVELLISHTIVEKHTPSYIRQRKRIQDMLDAINVTECRRTINSMEFREGEVWVNETLNFTYMLENAETQGGFDILGFNEAEQRVTVFREIDGYWKIVPNERWMEGDETQES